MVEFIRDPETNEQSICRPSREQLLRPSPRATPQLNKGERRQVSQKQLLQLGQKWSSRSSKEETSTPSEQDVPRPSEDHIAGPSSTKGDSGDGSPPTSEYERTVLAKEISLKGHQERTMRETRDNYFKDGTTKIDFLLVYETDEEQEPILAMNLDEYAAELAAQGVEADPVLIRMLREKEWRRAFVNNLRTAGVLIEKEAVRVGGKQSTNKIHFIKLSVPWDLRVKYAELLCFRTPLPLMSIPKKDLRWTGWHYFRWLVKFCELDVPNTPRRCFTTHFKVANLANCMGAVDQENYFTVGHRIRIAQEILRKTEFGDERKGYVGIDRLVEEGAFTAAFPLHEGSYQAPRDQKPCNYTRRQILYEYWARWGRWYKFQPLDHIREYFGEGIALYFAWLGFYTVWLLPASVLGLLIFVYGMFNVATDHPTSQLCKSGNFFKMCPRCDESLGCTFWYLSETCWMTHITYLFDHPGTAFYACFLSFWAVAFLKYWKRECARLVYDWDCLNYVEDEEPPRPEFAIHAYAEKRNPVTRQLEPSFPSDIRKRRMVTGYVILLFMASLVFVAMLAIIIFRILISIPLYRQEQLKGLAHMISSWSGAFINVISMVILQTVYGKLAHKLTQWEMHRTQTEFENNLTIKLFMFQFVNYYSTLFYIAFFKGRFVGYPGRYRLLFGLRNEECSGNDCLSELAWELAVIMITKQIINNTTEVFLPMLQTWIKSRKTQVYARGQLTQWEIDYTLVPDIGLFKDYLEVVLQFGFITIFVAAFPLAPLFAMINNWTEIRVDAQKLLCQTRRVVPERAQNIGIWLTILEFIACIAIISNAFLIAFTSDFLTRILYRYSFSRGLSGYLNFTLSVSPPGTASQTCMYKDFRDLEGNLTPFYWRLMVARLTFVLVFEHVVFIICRVIDGLVPDVPHDITVQVRRERYLAKQALTDSNYLLEVAAKDPGGIVVDVDSDGGPQNVVSPA
ncbi:anoctamin-7-like isoform X3 [Varroa destructor]|uniref:Anoctamin n=1 Tax=Varroa destructor TaxID=109461 RepID=A0A7M7L0F4_VARDE|nr:anoctamin-7-like isoform X3 [Varroa destructor]